MKKENQAAPVFTTRPVPRPLIFLTIIVSLFYLSWWLDFRHAAFWPFYLPLFLGEIYHLLQVGGFLHTVWKLSPPPPRPRGQKLPPVDVFITVCGEPVEVVRRTVRAAKKMVYPRKKIYLLNDGYVAGKKNWREIEKLAQEEEVFCLTRRQPGGYKAGNVNHALRQTNSPLIALFDADQVPRPNFLRQTAPYLAANPRLALVQTPQYYTNSPDNELTAGAWEQQELFFGPICVGKNNYNAAFWCGTNALLRRRALEEINGLPQDNIAEDFLASLFLHQRGWQTLYLPQVLADGLAPPDLVSYAKQQFRWARGSLEIILRHNPFFKKGLSFSQRLQYLYSASYHLNGVVVLIDILIPLLVLLTGRAPVVNDPAFLLYFAPFIVLILLLLMIATNFSVTFRALQFSVSLFFIQIQALGGVILQRRHSFAVTPKIKIQQNGFFYGLPHWLYLFSASGIILWRLHLSGPSASILNNSAWIIFNLGLFFPFLRLSLPPRSAVRLFFQPLLAGPKQWLRQRYLFRQILLPLYLYHSKWRRGKNILSQPPSD